MAEDLLKVKLNCRIRCDCYIKYSIDCRPELGMGIVLRDNEHMLETDVIQTDNHLTILLQITESFLGVMSIKSKAAFSRVYWTPNPIQNELQFIERSAYSPVGTGLSVRNVDTPKLDSEKIRGAVITATTKILERVKSEPDSFTILGFYTTANWFLNANLLREAAIAYFGVVEAICARKINKICTFSESDIKDAIGPMGYGLSETDKATVLRGHKIRGILSHGNIEKYRLNQFLSRKAKGPFDALLLNQHSLGTNTVASAQLTFPVLECKDAADILLEKYFEI